MPLTKPFLENIISPIIAVVAGFPDKSSIRHKLADTEVPNEAGEVIKEEAYIHYGTFIQNTIDFAILALVIFIAIKIASNWMASEDDPEPSDEIKLLTEIRDSLAKSA